MRLTCLLLAVLCAACGPSGENRPADTIIVNGRIFTGVAEAPDAEALAIRDGRILAVGSNEEVQARAGKKTEVIDANDRRVVPGLTDAHAHFGASPEGVWMQVGEGPTPDPEPRAVLDAVAAEAVKPGGRGWIYAVIGPAVLDDRSLRREALDKASQARPVMLISWTGHGTVLNTRGLMSLGFGEVYDPPGGWCERNADGTCSGLLREMAEFTARRRLRRTVPADRLGAEYRKAAEAYLRRGVTAVHDMALSHSLEQVAAALNEAQVKLRWSLYRAPTLEGSMDEAWAEDYSDLALPERARLAGIKWFMDGTPVEGDAAMSTAYAGGKDWQGRLNFTEPEIRRILKQGLERGEQLALHAVGDRALKTVFSAMREIAPAEKWQAHRLRIEHGDGLHGELQKEAAELGVVLVQNPLHFSPDAGVFKRLTADQRAGFQQLHSALENDVALALGSDADGPGRNPFLNIMLAVAHPASPDEALSVRQALLAYTAGGALAGKREDERGTLEPGRLADLAILSRDILQIPPEDLPSTNSVLTMIEGEVVYRADEPAQAPAPE